VHRQYLETSGHIVWGDGIVIGKNDTWTWGDSVASRTTTLVAISFAPVPPVTVDLDKHWSLGPLHILSSAYLSASQVSKSHLHAFYAVLIASRISINCVHQTAATGGW
jgi:hypothetical protein